MTRPILCLLDPGDIEPAQASQPFTAPMATCAGPRNGQKFCVLYAPWERTHRVISLHRTATAAHKRAQKERREFRRQNPNGYGHTWDACSIEGTER